MVHITIQIDMRLLERFLFHAFFVCLGGGALQDKSCADVESDQFLPMQSQFFHTNQGTRA